MVLVEQNDTHTSITLNRPEVRNALSIDLLNELEESISAVAKDENIRSLVLLGADPCFCAGMDLRTARDDADATREALRAIARIVVGIRGLKIPVIAQVQGAAVGGGCGLMTACDFAVSHPEAKLGYPEVDNGICPAVVAPLLIRKIGGGRARALLLAGGTISGQEAFHLGLLTHLVPQEDIAETVEKLTARLAKGGPNALAITKHWINEIENPDLAAEVNKGAELSADVVAGPEAQERLARSRKR